MYRKLFTFVAAVLLLAVAGCSRIGPGHVGIKVNMAGSDKGVLDTPTQTGWVWYNPIGTSVIEYPTTMQTAKWTKSTDEGKPVDESVTFTNKDSMAINADISLSYSLVANKVPSFYVKFLTADLDSFTDGFLRNVARDCLNEGAGKYAIEQIMGDNAAFLAESRKCLQDKLSEYGVTIEQFGFIGAPRPPQQVVEQITEKIRAEQISLQKQLELQQVQADANKQIAAAEGQAKAQIASANGDAQANQIRTASITPTILRMKELENQHDMIWRWNGVSPTTVVGEGKGVILQLPQESGNQ